MSLPDLKKQIIERDPDYIFYKKGYCELKKEKEKNETYLKNKLKTYEETFSKLEKDNATTIQNNIMAATMLTTAKTAITPLVAQHTKTTYENNHVAASTIFKSTDSNASAELKAGVWL